MNIKRQRRAKTKGRKWHQRPWGGVEGDFHGLAEGWHKQSRVFGADRRSPGRAASTCTHESFRSTLSLPPRPWVRLEPVLGQLAARYHYLLDSGQSNLSACSCFIELDKYNMWLTAIIYYRTALFIQQAEAFGAFWLASLSLMELHSSDGSLWTASFTGFEPAWKLTCRSRGFSYRQSVKVET